MAEHLYEAIPHKPKALRVVRQLPDGTKETQVYRTRALSPEERYGAKRTITFARERIAANGGESGPTAIDKYGAGERSDWAREVLKRLNGVKGAQPLSCNDALQLGVALQRCEMERATKLALEANGDVTEDRLRRIYDDWRDAVIVATEKPTGEVVGGVQVVQGGAIPVEYHNWIASQADYATLSSLQGMQQLLLFGQVVSDTKFEEVPTFAMLYEPHAVPTIAAQLARYLIREGALPRPRYKSAFDALEKLFTERRDAFRHAFWSHFRRYDVKAVEEIERQIRALDIEVIGVRDAPSRAR